MFLSEVDKKKENYAKENPTAKGNGRDKFLFVILQHLFYENFLFFSKNFSQMTREHCDWNFICLSHHLVPHRIYLGFFILLYTTFEKLLIK